MLENGHDKDTERKVLNVGGNSKKTPIPRCYEGWRHDLLDIDPMGEPDICCDARELHNTTPRVYDSIYCSHNLEHFYWHDLPSLLRGFRIVLKKDGFLYLVVPDVGTIIREVVERDMDPQDVLYVAPAGPIRVHDVLYGFGHQIEQSGQDFFAHKCAFSKATIVRLLEENGFPFVICETGGYDLRVIALTKEPSAERAQLLRHALLEV